MRQTAEQRGWSVVRVYSDRMSGASESRPGLTALMQDARRGAFDVVVVFRFDRFARSVKQLVLALEEFRTLGIGFVSQQEALDTSTPMGKMIFTVLGAVAELERSIIQERVIMGLQRVKKAGKILGRPKIVIDRQTVRELYKAGNSVRTIAAEMGLTKSTVHNIVNAK